MQVIRGGGGAYIYSRGQYNTIPSDSVCAYRASLYASVHMFFQSLYLPKHAYVIISHRWIHLPVAKATTNWTC